MVKKMIIAVALLGLLVSAAQAMDTEINGGKKLDKWPAAFIKQDLCTFPVKLKIPWYVAIDNCSKLSISLSQVECSKEADWPCFEGCKTFTIRANFDYTLYCSIVDKVMGGTYSAQFTEVDGSAITPDNDIELEACEHEVEVCVTLTKAILHADGDDAEAGDTVTVASVLIQILPEGNPYD